MDEQRQDGQPESIYNISVPILDIALKTRRERWTIETGDERGSGRSVLAVRHDHDVDDIFLATHSYDEISKLKQTLEKTAY